MHRRLQIFEPFYDKADGAGGAGGGGADESAAGDAGEFSSESASVAFTQAPGDTTQGVEQQTGAAGTEEMSASAEGVNDGGTEEVIEGIEGAADKVAEQPKAAAPAGKGQQPKAGKKNVPLSERVTDLKKQVDTLTHQKHKTTSEFEKAQTKLADLNRQIQDAEKKLAGGTTTATTGADGTKPSEQKADAADPIPDHPDYRKFATDEEYDAAVAKWRTDVSAWHGRQTDSVRKSLEDGIEKRFEEHGQRQSSEQIAATVKTTLDKVRNVDAKKWAESTEKLKGLTSAWHDPEKHGERLTPFLSDLSVSLLMQGSEEGGTILTFLADDPDRAQRLADLLPTRPLRDALVSAPSVTPLLEYFATDEGAEEFEALKQMHPRRMYIALGALYSRLAPAHSGSGAAAHHVTQARPSSRPQGGTPGARSGGGGGTNGNQTGTGGNFDDWMAGEDARERADKLKLAGVVTS